MFTVTLACTADEPFTWTEVGTQAGGGLALVETLHVSVTVPPKPLDGVMVVVNVAELPAVTVAVVGLGADNAKLAAAASFTVNITVAGWVSDPSVPVTVIE